MTGHHNRPRRWAVTHTPVEAWVPVVAATYWTRTAADRASRRRGARYIVRPSDYAPYRYRKADIIAILQSGPRSVDGIRLRTAMHWDTVRETLLRMSREQVAVHRTTIDDTDPARGVWRYVPAAERV